VTLSTPQRKAKTLPCIIAAGSVLFSLSIATAQSAALPASVTTQTQVIPRRTRLIMKDGSFQLVLSYKISGAIVHYRSAERNGETEDVPLALVDLPATEQWARDHGPNTAQAPDRPVLNPELAKEEADRAARTPEVSPDLRLPEEDSVLALDTFSGSPELVPLVQDGGDLNKETAHNTLKLAINPASSPHHILNIRGERADIQLHAAIPTFYVRVGEDDEGDAGSGAITVDTRGATGRETPSGGSDASSYVLARLSILSDSRVLNSFRIAALGVKHQPDVIELKIGEVPGGHWLKLIPTQPLEPGEYALVEVLSDHEVNLGVWDFGVHSDAKENDEAIRPEPKRPATLERRSNQ
jgi:hypothetical protein